MCLPHTLYRKYVGMVLLFEAVKNILITFYNNAERMWNFIYNGFKPIFPTD